MALNYSSKHDISYANYNNKNIPWKLNTSIISQNNQITNPSLNLGTINNNLVIESSQNDILFFTSQNENKKVIVKNNMVINNLDVSNNLTTKLNDTSSITLNNKLYFSSLPVNIIGDLKVSGAITVIGSSATGLIASKSEFINVTLSGSRFTDVSIVNCDISVSDFSNVNIINSYINAIPNGFGYDKSNNAAPNKAIFTDISLDRLILDSYINFDANASNSISIRSYDYDDYSKLVISKPLTVESGIRIGENISNISVFNGTISCNTLYYSQLVPDIRLNTYFDISIGQVSVSGNNIPVNNSFNIGSTNYKFNEIISTNYDGNLSGTATSANDLVKNLDMSFNNLDIYGTITLNRQNLNQFLSSDLLSINAADISFSNANKSVRDLSASLYSKAGFDLCLNTNFTKNRLVELSFTQLNNRIISISNIVYTKSDFDLCLNRNVLRTNDLSAIVAVVTNPGEIYPTLGYIDSSLNKITNVTLSNELVFPYAITYIDDLVEDTNLKESYSYNMTTNKATTTVTSAYTITYTRVWSSTYVDTTLQKQPDDINHKYLILENIGSSITSLRRKWYDVLGADPQPAVYKKTVAAVSKTYINTTFELNTSSLSWDTHKTQAATTTTTPTLIVERSLAVITNEPDNTTIKNLLPVSDAAWIGAERIKSRTWNTGGTVTEDLNYIYHTFTTVGSHTLTISNNVTVDYLIVAGGGSGGAGRGGGGGGGGVKSGTTTLTAGSHNITVGAGGARVVRAPGNDGGSSSIESIIATGGGGGGGEGQGVVALRPGRPGGSGGGSSAFTTDAGGTGILGQGFAGSARFGEYTGGGGGGAGAAASGKDGAIGISSNITGATRYYAGGGGAGGNVGNNGVAYGGVYKVSNGEGGGGNGTLWDYNYANTYIWTYHAWTDDASIGLGHASTYTVAVNLGLNASAVTINGVVFQGHALSGSNFLISGGAGGINILNSGNDGSVNFSGSGIALVGGYIHYDTPTESFVITLKNLTYGATYKTSIFSVGGAVARNQTFTANGVAQEIINQSTYGSNKGIIINITFIADNTGNQIISIDAVNNDLVFGMRALANRLISTSSSPAEPYTDAVPNTGGGGGGNDPGFGPPTGAGGSGIVIIRYSRNMYLEGGYTYWKWYNGDQWSFTKWATNEPGPNESYAKIQSDGNWHDANNHNYQAIYMKKNYTPARSAETSYELDTTLLTWEGHNARALQRSGNGITYTLASIIDSNENEAVANAAGSYAKVYIGGKRKILSSATGRTSNDWEWSNGTVWNYTNFYEGYIDRTYSASYTGGTVPSGSSTTTIIPQDANTITSPAVFETSTNISQTNVKLPLLLSSSNGSIIATATAISILNLPANPSNTTSATRNVSGFTDIDGGSNTVTIQEFTNYASNSNTNITDYKIQKRTLKYQYDTYTYVNSYYPTNNGLTTGSFKISDNSNNRSNYISPFSVNTISTTYSCIALTNDGMFVALGKASVVTVYMKTSTGWTTIGSAISINFTAYTNTDCNILWNGFASAMYKNLQNLAINYISESSNPTLFLAFGNTRTSVQLYSYDNATWSLSNGFYSVTGGSWTLKTSYSAAALSVSTNTNFGYFVTLSHSPNVLGFTVDDKFYTYNCTNYTIRGSRQTLPNSNSTYTNIIAFKKSNDAEKIIVSNTYYVFVYKWNINITDWTLLTTINLVSTAITFTYPYTSTTPIPAGPRSLDISNISSDECVFAIGFPDVLIDTSANRKARGYVEYWKYSNPTLTRLATLVPRKRNIDSSNIDIDEYFFSGGGIKITNANTILVAPNFKFHFNNNNKNYTLDTSNVNWANHNSNARNVSGREMVSIENEADNELVKITARNNAVWIGAKRTALDAATGITSAEWQWSDLSSIWNYTSFASGQPNSFSEKRIQSASGSWYDTLDSDTLRAVYMTRLQYSLNTFSIFDRFFFHSSGFSSSYANTAISTTVIAKWMITDTPNRSIDFKANGSIVSNGKGIFTVSDIRLKENIVDSTPKLEDLLKVRVVNYNLKGCKDNKLIGVVAQELEQIFPTLVNDGELSMHDIYLGKTESYKSVKYSCFDVILIKAFQEHVAIINKLTSQLDEIDTKTKLLKAINKDYFILKQELDLLKSENELFKLNINEILKLI